MDLDEISEVVACHGDDHVWEWSETWQRWECEECGATL